MNYKILILFAFSIILTSCGLLDRGAKDEMADLEPIPEETITTEPSILIDDEEMIAQLKMSSLMIVDFQEKNK